MNAKCSRKPHTIKFIVTMEIEDEDQPEFARYDPSPAELDHALDMYWGDQCGYHGWRIYNVEILSENEQRRVAPQH